MCGIAGIAGLNGQPVSRQELKQMCDALTHRGPDDEGYYVGNGIGLGHRRLSIIDLDTGHQPVRNEDGNIRVIFNGEIYNYREVRQDLKRRGHSFYTSSDTETIVHLYEEYGHHCVQHLRGMFAIALWDNRTQTLFLARDRLGIKPLFFGEFEGRLCFASELKALLQLPYVNREFDWAAVNHLFSFLATPSAHAVIKGVNKLEPGHTLTWTRGHKPQVRRYWDVAFEPDYKHDETYFVENIRALLAESVNLRMVSDVPLGAFLSGGIDSSAVVATMAHLSPDPIKTFSIGFNEHRYNEATHARAVAEHLRTDHRELILRPDVIDMLDDLPWYLDEPFGDSSAIPTYMVSRMAGEDVTVVLSGDGGDELFAGYDKYVTEQKQRQRDLIPVLIRKILAGVGNHMREGMKGRNFLRHLKYDGAERYMHSSTIFDQDGRSELFSRDIVDSVLRHDPWQELAADLPRYDEDWLSAIQYMDIKHYLPLDILTKVDRMSMANSVEARVPLLDHKLVEFAATIPSHLRMRNGSTKHILKQAMRGTLPEDIIDRPKQGFAVPLETWFRGQLDDFARDLLLSEKSRQRGIFNLDYIDRLLKLHNRGRPLQAQLWTLISFELWCRRFIDEPPSTVQNDTRPLTVVS